jgi:hypothetical protein
MKKMATSNVLIVGMKGLGVEIGKLLINPQEDCEADTSSQKYLSGRCQDRYYLRSEPCRDCRPWDSGSSTSAVFLVTFS